MTSEIDPSKPTTGMALTSDVRANFFAAATEITALQNQIAALQADVAKLMSRRQGAQAMVTTNPPNTSSTEFVVGDGILFTANSTRVIVNLQGQLGNTQNGQSSEVRLVYGLGGPPVQGTPVSATNGQYMGGTLGMLASRANDFVPFAIEALLESQTVNYDYWFSVAYRAVSGTATVSQCTLVGFEVLDSLLSLEETETC